jgi:hypothetical protein
LVLKYQNKLHNYLCIGALFFLHRAPDMSGPALRLDRSRRPATPSPLLLPTRAPAARGRFRHLCSARGSLRHTLFRSKLDFGDFFSNKFWLCSLFTLDADCVVFLPHLFCSNLICDVSKFVLTKKPRRKYGCTVVDSMDVFLDAVHVLSLSGRKDLTR